MIKLEAVKGYRELEVLELELNLDFEGTKVHLQSKMEDLKSYLDNEEEIIKEMEAFIDSQADNTVNSLVGCRWEEVEQYLKGYITVDEDNVDSEEGTCIVDFMGCFSCLSVEGEIIEDELIIDQDAEIYRNCL